MPTLPIIRSIILVLLLWILGVLIVAVTYGLILEIPLNNLLFVTSFLVLPVITLSLNKLIKVKRPFINLLVAIALLALVVLGKQSIVADIACRAQGGIGLDKIIRDENLEGKTITFCGYLQRCRYVSLELKPIQYEVCSLSDIWNEGQQIQFYTTTISNSDDPLVQISNDAQLLSGLPKNTIIIDAGFRGTPYYYKCWFDEICGDDSQYVVNVFRNKNMQQLTIEPTR